MRDMGGLISFFSAANQKSLLSSLQKLWPEKTTTILPPPVISYDIEDTSSPEGWDRGYITIDNVAVPYYIAHAPHARGAEITFSGHKATHALTARDVKKYRTNDITAFWVNLLPPNVCSDEYMAFQKKVIGYFLFDPQSPVRTKLPEGLTKTARAHSTGAQICMDLATHVDTAEKMHDYKLFTAEGIFIDNAGASLAEWFPFRHAFTAYSYLHKNSLVDKTLAGAYYLALEFVDHYAGRKGVYPESNLVYHAMPYIPAAAVRHLSASVEAVKYLMGDMNGYMARAYQAFGTFPAYGEVLVIRKPGRAMYKEINTGHPDRVKPVIPIVSYHGIYDKYACNKVGEKFMTSCGAECITVDVAHKPLEESRETFEAHLARLDTVFPAKKLPEYDVTLGEQPVSTAPGYWPPLGLPVWLGQRSAGFFNAAARVFKNRLGRRVADAEMGREPERPAVNAGDSFTL